MNRLVLIGNGFDLAHGLETGYHHFIGYVWKQIFESFYNTVKTATYNRETKYNDDLKLITIRFTYDGQDVRGNIFIKGSIGVTLSGFTLSDPKNFIIDKSDYENSLDKIIELLTKTLECKYTNEFFGIVTQNYQEKKWSDIEADYYRELKKAKAKVKAKENEAAVEKLNKEFNQIKELLKEYLKEQNDFKRNEETYNLIYSPILLKEIRLSSWDTYFEDICNRLYRHYLDSKTNERAYFNMYDLEYLIGSKRLNVDLETSDWSNIKEKLKTVLHKNEGRYESDTYLHHLFRPENILLLNFNYTETQANYDTFKVVEKSFCYQEIETTTCHIHGELDDKLNPMIFGYGDEEAEDYKDMENSEIPGLLDNVKSINYLHASSYRDMERFIESGSYQIYLMGMSCGLADRTMLRKLFQHPNCISIKPFYYEWEDEKTKEEKNNYTEIVQNVSRCFSNKDLLRSTVVNKINCKPLPQSPQKNKENPAPLYQVHRQ